MKAYLVCFVIAYIFLYLGPLEQRLGPNPQEIIVALLGAAILAIPLYLYYRYCVWLVAKFVRLVREFNSIGFRNLLYTRKKSRFYPHILGLVLGSYGAFFIIFSIFLSLIFILVKILDPQGLVTNYDGVINFVSENLQHWQLHLLALVLTILTVIFDLTDIQTKWKNAKSSIEQGDYINPSLVVKKLADYGHSEAQKTLGFMYQHGLGVTQNYKQAFSWYQKAAEDGNPNAQTALAWCYIQGQGVEQDYQEAVRLYQLAVKQNHVDAQFSLGLCYETGTGVEQDYKKAVRLYKLAAIAGNTNAQSALDKMYHEGDSVARGFIPEQVGYATDVIQGEKRNGNVPAKNEHRPTKDTLLNVKTRNEHRLPIFRYILIVILGFGLHVTNPSKSGFIEFASIQIKRKYPELDFKPEGSATGLEKLFSGFGNAMVSAYLADYTTQKDYLIFSVFEVDMKLARDFGINEKNIKVLGIAGKYLPLEY